MLRQPLPTCYRKKPENVKKWAYEPRLGLAYTNSGFRSVDVPDDVGSQAPRAARPRRPAPARVYTYTYVRTRA